jgi:hypothetical protein
MEISVEKEHLLSFNEANSLLRYDPETGLLFWRINRRRRRAGAVAGSIAPTNGRPVITINARNYLQHRVAWLLFHGKWPSKFIDHINSDIRDNRISNLREANKVQNGGNRKPQTRKGLGNLKGASLTAKGKWRSSIKINGKTKNLGDYLTELEAHQAYCRAASVAFGEYMRAA